MNDENKQRFLSLCEEIKRPGISELLEWLGASDFYEAPASTRFHGSYAGGLLEHSLNVYNELIKLLEVYPEIKEAVSRESVIISSLFHDLCKVNCYKTEKRNRKNAAGFWESYDAYTFSPKLSYGGHGSKSVFIIQQFMKLTVDEAVAINCHMSTFSETNVSDVSDAFEQFPFAWLLSVADQSATFTIESKGGI